MSGSVDRRTFLQLAAASVSAGAIGSARPLSAGASNSQVSAILFDAFVIFDPRPVFALAEEIFPQKGSALADEWRTRQFEYAWLRVVSKRYADFWQVTRDALQFAANKLQLDLTRERRDRLMTAYLQLKTWPDVAAPLLALEKSGFRLGFLSNLTRPMLESNIRSAGLQAVFEHVLSTDEAKSFKPDPAAYNLGIEALKLQREEIMFAAFAGWDAAGAKHFGYPTFWINRQKLPPEELGAMADGTAESLSGLVQFLSR